MALLRNVAATRRSGNLAASEHGGAVDTDLFVGGRD
jgi:hypothetical protein